MSNNKKDIQSFVVDAIAEAGYTEAYVLLTPGPSEKQWAVTNRTQDLWQFFAAVQCAISVFLHLTPKDVRRQAAGKLARAIKRGKWEVSE